MITLKLTQKQTELIIHSLGSEAIRLNNDIYMETRNDLLLQLKKASKQRKSYKLQDAFTYGGHTFKGTMKEAMQGVAGFENDNMKPDLLTWCKDNLTEIK